MNLEELIEKQWSDYADRHRNRTNLLIHIVTVPVVWIGAFQFLAGLFLLLLGVPGAFGMLFWAAVLIGVALFAQARGNAMESKPPVAVADPAERAKRIVVEQFINFPRFVLTGDWLRNLKGAA